MNLEARCVCGVAFGEHRRREPHPRIEHGQVRCSGFRRPLTARDWPDFWPDTERLDDTSERSASAESSAADRNFDAAFASVDVVCFSDCFSDS